MKRTNKQEGAFEIIAALLVLFTAILDPLVSVILSIVALAGFGLWNLFKK